MGVHGKLRALGDHLSAEGGDGARHVLRIEIDSIIGTKIVFVDPEEGHGGDGRSDDDWLAPAIS